MSFIPNNDDIITSLYGVGATRALVEELADLPEEEEEKLIKNRKTTTSSSTHDIIRLFLIILISAIIFVTVISIYEIIRTTLNYYFSASALHDENSHNAQDDIERTMIADYNQLLSTIAFAGICIIIAIILLPLIFYILRDYID